jgi:hypothetical protein
MSTRIRDIVKKDRALYDKAQKAFVSWVRRLAVPITLFVSAQAMAWAQNALFGAIAYARRWHAPRSLSIHIVEANAQLVTASTQLAGIFSIPALS